MFDEISQEDKLVPSASFLSPEGTETKPLPTLEVT